MPPSLAQGFQQLAISSIIFASGGKSSDFHPSRMTYLSSSLSNQCLSNLNFLDVLISFVRISTMTGR